MKKIMVADVSQSNIILSAFEFTDSNQFKILSQVNVAVDQGMKRALLEIETDIGPILRETSDFYVITSNKVRLQDLELDFDVSDLTNLTKEDAIRNVVNLVKEEVGEVLILDINRLEANIYLFRKGEPFIKEKVRSELEVEYIAVSSNEVTAKEVVLLKKCVDRAIKHVIKKLALNNNLHNLAELRWVIGTGEVITNLPNSMDSVKEALPNSNEVAFRKGGFPVLIDQYNIFTSVGALTQKYREPIWQLFLESLGVV